VGTGTKLLNAPIRRDWADTGSGALVTKFSQPDFTSSGCGPKQAFDLSLSSGWTSTNTGPKSATVRLPKVVDLTGLAVDPAPGCGLDTTASTRNLKIETSSNGTRFTTVANRTFTAGQAHKLNTVATSTKPRKVRFLRVTMQGNLGHPQYMGLGEVVIYGRPSDLVAPAISGATIPGGQTIRSISGPAGFKIRAHLSEAGTMKGALTIPPAKARQLHIPAQIGSGTLGFTAAATKTMTMRLTTAAKNAIKNQPSLTVTAQLNATDRSFNKARPVSKSATLPH